MPNRGYALLLPAVLALATAARGEGPLVVVADKARDRLTFLDAETGAVVGRATTGHRPHELAVSPDGRTAFVSNYGAGDTVSEIDLPARRERRKIGLGRFRDPHGLAVGRGGARLYVTCEADRAVVEVDTATGAVLRSFDTGQELTHMIALDPDGATLFAADLRGGSVAAVDLRAGAVAFRVATGAGCEGLDVTPDGTEVWTANKTAETVTVVGLSARAALANLPCPGRPIRLKVTPDGRRALVACARSGELAVFDVAARREVRRVKVGAWPIGLAVDPTGRRAFVAETEGGRVSVVDLGRGAVVGSFEAGRVPDGLGFVPPTPAD